MPAVRNVRSRFSAPVGMHSQKPSAFYSLVETMYPFSPETHHYEMFARTVRPGYVQFGNQLGSIPLTAEGQGASHG